MTDEPFWDELGIAWQAMPRAPGQSLDRIEAHFRRETALLRGVIAVAMLAGTAGFALAALTLWQAWRLEALNFGTRGLALLVIAVIMWMVVRTLWPVRRSDDARALRDYVDLGLARTTRGLRVCGLGFAVCTVAAVLGLVGTALRTQAGHPPALSPFIAVGVIVLIAAGVDHERRRFRRERARFAYLRDALRPPG